MTAAYAELGACSNFSFLHGASHAEEMVATSAALGQSAIAICDRNSVAGLVRGHLEAVRRNARFIPGCRLALEDGAEYLAWPTDRTAWGRLSRLLSLGKMRAPKGECHLSRAELIAHAEGLAMARIAPDVPDASFTERLCADAAALRGRVPLGLHLAIAPAWRGDDRRRRDAFAAMGMPLLAVGDARMHAPERRRLADVLTAIRLGTTVDRLGFAAEAHAERHLKPPAEMARLFADRPDAIAAGLRIMEACDFSLTELRYEYPEEITRPDRTPQQDLEERVWDGTRTRWPDGVPEKVRAQLAEELALVEYKDYAPYFLTVHEVVRFAQTKGILCQGRGSAANSVICYVLGITGVDPMRHELLFARFLSRERNEPPDIDVDFEHERREEVIQHIYERYGRDRAGIAATVIRYRPRSAIREVGKAFGLSEDMTARIAGQMWGSGHGDSVAERAGGAGVAPLDRRMRLAVELADELVGFPRHLSQHVGGFVIARGKLTELCPVANAAMAERTTIEWDKDDIEALGLLKVDVLALGMLTCIRKAFALIEAHHGRKLSLASIPHDDGGVYDMLCKADAIGVFQVESRGQMNMLPRLRPRDLYDLAIEVAIVRPGPIQGNMVHPYLRRRSGKEPHDYPSEELKQVLKRTLGVPLFQEQAMQIAMVAAKFTADEADGLRRAMATFRNAGTIRNYRDKLIEGMVANDYTRDFAERCYRQIEGFGEYGFPESHAISFALLAYVSAWIKCHYPAVFACALLNSQPMGFYSPAQIVRDAGAHDVTVRPVDVQFSEWDCTLEPSPDGLALRLGFRQVRGFSEDDAHALVAARRLGNGAPFGSVEELARRAGLTRAAVATLARADAFGSLALKRRDALWEARGVESVPLPLFAAAEGRILAEPQADLPALTQGEEVIEDYETLSLSLKSHPCRLLRPDLSAEGLADTRALANAPDGARIRLAGLVLMRQQPGSAKGIIFLTLEDENGNANVVVFADVFRAHRAVVIGAKLIEVAGIVERVTEQETPIVHLVAKSLADRGDLLARLPLRGGGGDPLLPVKPLSPRERPGRYLPPSRDFH